MYQVCDHEYVKDELNNFRCSKCDFHATWGMVQEKNFVMNMANGALGTPLSKHEGMPRACLVGYIEAVRKYPSVNFTPKEDKELVRYAEKLLRGMK